jgi:hypothetical protein
VRDGQSTVKIHRGNLMKKMGAKSLAELVRMAEVLGVRGAGFAVELRLMYDIHRRPNHYVAFQMAEVAIPRNLFADILQLIAELRPPPVTSPA